MADHLSEILQANLEAGGSVMLVSAGTLHPYFDALCKPVSASATPRVRVEKHKLKIPLI